MNSMKKLAAILVVLAIIAAAVPAFAADRIVTAKIEKVTEKKSVKGNPYASILITEKKSLSGIDYEGATFITAFERDLPKVKTLRPGQTLKAIVNSSTGRDGRDSNILVSIVEAK